MCFCSSGKTGLALLAVVAIAGAATIGGYLASGSVSADKLETPDIGTKLPDFTMTDVNGESHTLSDYQGKIVVLNFSSQHCPFSRRVDPELTEIAEEYAEEDVVILSIDANDATTPEDIKAYAEERELSVPILNDEALAYADKLGATRTPEVYILDTEGTLVYHGAFDDSKRPDSEKGETNYIRKTVDALLAGATVEPTESKAFGCNIQR